MGTAIRGACHRRQTSGVLDRLAISAGRLAVVGTKGAREDLETNWSLTSLFLLVDGDENAALALKRHSSVRNKIVVDH